MDKAHAAYDPMAGTHAQGAPSRYGVVLRYLSMRVVGVKTVGLMPTSALCWPGTPPPPTQGDVLLREERIPAVLRPGQAQLPEQPEEPWYRVDPAVYVSLCA